MNLSGGLFCWEKQSQKIRPKNSGPKFERPKFVSQNSALNSGSGGAKSPVQTFVPDSLPMQFQIAQRQRNRSLLKQEHPTSAPPKVGPAPEAWRRCFSRVSQDEVNGIETEREIARERRGGREG